MTITENIMKANLPKGTRIEFHLTEKQLNDLMDACKPVIYMVIGGVPPPSPQENANAAWASLGAELGFDYMTVQPVSGKGNDYFTAAVA